MSDILPQRIVPFYSDELVAVQQPDGTIYVPLSRLCDNLELDQQGQARRIQRHAVLKEGLETLTVQTAGGPQLVQCLKLTLLPLWLSGVQAGRITDKELREKLIRYQREAADVLWRAFKPQILVEEPPANRESELAIGQLEQIIEQSKAMQRMAEEQIALIRRMDTAARVVKAIQTDVTEVKGEVAEVKVRLGILENRLHPAGYITDEQQANILNLVQAIAMELTERDPSKNHFASIHTEIHRRYKVRSYTMIRIEQYPAVLAFLETWHQAGSAPAELPSAN